MRPGLTSGNLTSSLFWEPLYSRNLCKIQNSWINFSLKWFMQTENQSHCFTFIFHWQPVTLTNSQTAACSTGATDFEQQPALASLFESPSYPYLLTNTNTCLVLPLILLNDQTNTHWGKVHYRIDSLLSCSTCPSRCWNCPYSSIPLQ